MTRFHRTALITFLLFAIFLVKTDTAQAKTSCWTSLIGYNTAMTTMYNLQASGYTCSTVTTGSSACTYQLNVLTSTITCTLAVATNYSANLLNSSTLQGFQNTSISSQVFSYERTHQLVVYNTPFIYLNNAPMGNISVSLVSAFNSYLPKPLFNQTNGWMLDSKTSGVSVSGVTVKNLFYQLATDKITMSRNGRNFTTKASVVSFLKHSDFLSRMGLTAEQQKNSLSYFLPKLAAAADEPYYYLTILDKDSINDISSLKITPEPSEINRQYFALYPTTVPVQTTGDFVFPSTAAKTGFAVQETGEFLVTPSMFIFFK